VRSTERLAAAARFSAAYTRADGSAPLWATRDDARALPLGVGPVNDHRHLLACTAVFLGDANWLPRPTAAGMKHSAVRRGRTPYGVPLRPTRADAFPNGGAYVVARGYAHVFIDCGPVGLAVAVAMDTTTPCRSSDAGSVVDRGGCGLFVYTASFEDAITFVPPRRTTLRQIDGEEINRFVSPDLLGCCTTMRSHSSRGCCCTATIWCSRGATRVTAGCASR